ncbi:hypothetical protein ACAW63_22685 [Pseudomonas sp. QE6]|uniref:hypothetical protein n=1 Tax=Pseudomonas sp. QE6 TaxID=3242491 RepID=UPI0035295C20
MKNDEIMELDFSGWPVPDEYLIEMGRVGALWASLETCLNVFIGKLAGFNEYDPKPFILVNHSSFPQKLDMLGALCEQLVSDYPQLTDYKGVIAKLRSAQKKRNIYAHNAISPDPDTGKMKMANGSARGTLKVSVDTVELADIRRASIEINEANVALYKLVLGQTIPPMAEVRKKK